MKPLRHRSILATAMMSCFISHSISAVELLNIKNGEETTKVSLGGYAKVDIRHVNGDIAYQDYWLANFPGGEAIETSTTGFNVKESRINLKVSHGDVSGFVEIDFYGNGGNEVVSNSTSPRLRHFYINYKNWSIGQNWSTFMPLHAIPEALDFGGPHVGEVFIRQVQVRYTYGNWQFAIENPETNGDGDVGTSTRGVGVTGTDADPDEAIPDFVARYNRSGDWGVLSIGALARVIDQGGLDETGIALNIAGKINTFGKDDFRFQVSAGDTGRYVGAGLTADIVINPENDNLEVEQTVAYTVSYRHFWNETLRSTAFYGVAETDVLERERAHWGVNLINNVTDRLSVGVEVGNFAIDDEGIEAIDSNYFQFSTQFTF